LLGTFLNYGHKKFYNIVSRSGNEYPSLWQDQDQAVDDPDDLYENTGPGSALAARAANVAQAKGLSDQVDGKKLFIFLV